MLITVALAKSTFYIGRRNMKKSVKALSVILILAALFGLVGGGITLGDVMDSSPFASQ